MEIIKFVKVCFYKLAAAVGGIAPTGDVLCFVGINKVAERSASRGFRAVGVDEHQLDFHTLGGDTFDVYRDTLPYPLAQMLRFLRSHLGKPRKIRGELHEHAVAFHASYHARDRLSRLKAACVLLPRAKQLAQGDVDALGFIIDALDRHGEPHPAGKAFSGMRDARDGDCIHRQKRRHAASDVQKRAEGLHVCHAGIQDVPRAELTQIGIHAFLLHCTSGKSGNQFPVLMLDREDLTRHGFSDACKNCNVLSRLSRAIPHRFLGLDHAVDASQIHVQAKILIAPQCDPLHARPRMHRTLQPRRGGKVGAVSLALRKSPLGEKSFFHSVLLLSFFRFSCSILCALDRFYSYSDQVSAHTMCKSFERSLSMSMLCGDYRENVRRMDAVLRVEKNFDLIKKTMYVGSKEVTLYYIDGFVDTSLNKLMMYFLTLTNVEIPPSDAPDTAVRYFSEHHLPYVEAEVVGDANVMIQMLLSGTALMLGEFFGAYAIIIDSRTYPARSVAEPETDRVMMGSRDGFVETLIFNTAMIRRRIRDTALTMQYHTVGTHSKTDVVLCYIDGVADADYVNQLSKKLSSIDTGALTMGHESLAELLIRQRWYNPFPKIRYTERPDVAAAQLLEGSVLIICDTSPEVMVLPSSIFDFMQETNDFYFPPLTGTYIRFVRHLVFWSTLFLVPTWFLLIRNPAFIPEWLDFILPRETGRIPIFVQILLVEFMIDGLRLASMNTPSMLSNSLSVVGGLILGDFAVSIGWLIPEVILYMAFVSIANFTQRSYELGYAFKFLRIALVVLVQFFDLYGFGIGCLLIAVLLLSNKTVNGKRSYLYPLIPFHGRALLSLFVRLKKDRRK